MKKHFYLLKRLFLLVFISNLICSFSLPYQSTHKSKIEKTTTKEHVFSKKQIIEFCSETTQEFTFHFNKVDPLKKSSDYLQKLSIQSFKFQGLKFNKLEINEIKSYVQLRLFLTLFPFHIFW